MLRKARRHWLCRTLPVFACRQLCESGLHPDTADLVYVHTGISPAEHIHNGPFTLTDYHNGYLPCWSAGRLLSLLPYNDDFYWSLYRLEDIGKLCLIVSGRVSLHFSDSLLINVVLPAVRSAIDLGLMAPDHIGIKGDEWADVLRMEAPAEDPFERGYIGVDTGYGESGVVVSTRGDTAVSSADARGIVRMPDEDLDALASVKIDNPLAGEVAISDAVDTHHIVGLGELHDAVATHLGIPTIDRDRDRDDDLPF